ncbi:MAG: hypothetical protein WCT77_11065 [Bacteroidota bacterium]
MKKIRLLILFAIPLALVLSCTTAREHQSNLGSTQERELTAGLVQKEIKKGMSGAEVAEILGSPNIVTKDENESVTWIYDKIATEASYSQSQTSIFLILAGHSEQSGAASMTQKTLTVVIKFDANDKVKSFTYHASKF